MTKILEDKELLLRDLTARLSYGVKGIITYDKSNTTFTVEGIDNNVLHLSDAEDCYVEDFKPYLRPMSSMTEEECLELSKLKPIYDEVAAWNALSTQRQAIYRYLLSNAREFAGFFKWIGKILNKYKFLFHFGFY